MATRNGRIKSKGLKSIDVDAMDAAIPGVKAQVAKLGYLPFAVKFVQVTAGDKLVVTDKNVKALNQGLYLAARAVRFSEIKRDYGIKTTKTGARTGAQENTLV